MVKFDIDMMNAASQIAGYVLKLLSVLCVPVW
jgi:hypothetical protein